MSHDTAPQKPRTPKQNREDRLKAALKANMGRRKAQARARTDKLQADHTQSDEAQADNGRDDLDKEG
ncbi:hypothetical protein [Roseobacter sp. GAI101]|uniref:hypothetical protein n=1 Tax=Roseobacter sp. (strain GAI101) TaxID=391589 RepID=UPI00055B845B|nr:hypothetical protein [Roseobacter sp. GAI101]